MDLGWTQAKWTAFFERIGKIASSWYFAKRLDGELGARISVDEYLDLDYLFNDWDISGVELGVNTDSNGFLWVSAVVSAGNFTVGLYKDAGKAPVDKVAEGVIAVASTPDYLTLSEQNSSGLTASVYVAAASTDPSIFLVCTPGIIKQIENISVEDEIDSSLKTELTDRFSRISGSSIVSRIRSIARTQLVNYIRSKIKSTQAAAGGGKEVSNNGAIEVENYGVIGDLIDAMNDETNAGAQTVDVDSVFYKETSAPAADAENTGKGSLSTDYYEHLIAGVYTLECVSETIGAEQFRIAVVDKSGKKYQAASLLQIKELFNSIDLGLKDFELTRTIEDSDGGSGIAALLSSWTTQGESGNNTDGGVLYGKYVDSSKTLYLYSDSSLDDRYEVASGVWDETPGSTITLIESRSSGLSASVVLASDPGGDASDLQVNLNPFVEEDKFYLTVEKVGVAWWNEFFGSIFKVNLPSDASSPTIAKEPAHRGFSGLTEAGYNILRG